MITVEFETKQFNRDLQKFINASDVEEEKIIRTVTLQLLHNIIKPLPYQRHPVDTGRARAGWSAALEGLGGTFDFSQGIESKRNKVHEGRAKSGFINKLKDRYFKYVDIINAVYYITKLEYGWSRQAPSGMVRISMRKIRNVLLEKLNEMYLKQFSKYMKF